MCNAILIIDMFSNISVLVSLYIITCGSGVSGVSVLTTLKISYYMLFGFKKNLYRPIQFMTILEFSF